MKTLYLLLTVVFLLACGAPAYIAPEIPTPTQKIANTASPNVTNTPEMPIMVLVPLTVRSAPCESSREVAYIEAGAAVEIVGDPVTCREDGGRWIEIVKPHGFVNMRYLSLEER